MNRLWIVSAMFALSQFATADEQAVAPTKYAITAPAKRPVAKSVSLPHVQFGWSRGRHWLIESEHFRVETDVSPKAGQELAESLEKFHSVWLQLFPTIQPADKAVVPMFRVVLFKDRAEYLRQLATTKGIEVSTGIYLDEAKFSAFFAGPEAKVSTRFHEVAHQLFQEYSAAKPGVANADSMWLVEAAALYTETYAEHEGHATFGSWDAENLQFARFRALGGDFYLPLDKLATLGRTKLQEHPDIRRIYSEMAGLGQFFLTAENGKYREAFTEALRLTYRNKATANTLSELLKQPYVELDREYLKFLNVSDEAVARCPPRATMPKLCLRRTEITDKALSAFAACDQLEWIDLSLIAVTDVGFASFPASDKLKQLFLEATKITDKSASHIAEFKELQELYLSETSLTDAALADLAKLKRLKQLDLTGCPITDAAVDKIVLLKSLETLTISRTQITPAGIARLKKTMPRTKVIE